MEPFTHFRAEVRPAAGGGRRRVIFGEIRPAHLQVLNRSDPRTNHGPEGARINQAEWLGRQLAALRAGLDLVPPYFTAVPLSAGDFEIGVAREPEALDLVALDAQAVKDVESRAITRKSKITSSPKPQPRRSAR